MLWRPLWIMCDEEKRFNDADARLHYEIYALTQRLRLTTIRAEHEQAVSWKKFCRKFHRWCFDVKTCSYSHTFCDNSGVTCLSRVTRRVTQGCYGNHATALDATTFSITTLNSTTLSKMDLILTVGMTILEISFECHYAECRYTECRYTECRFWCRSACF